MYMCARARIKGWLLRNREPRKEATK